MAFRRKRNSGGAIRMPEAGYETYPETIEKYREEAEAVAPYRGETYYDIPPLKHSHYKWRTSLAFFCNTVSGGIQILSTLVDLLGGTSRKNRRLVRAGRYIALAGAGSSAYLLISALHTRSRWYNMLRLFKRTSPMSIGIWTITPFGILSGLAAAGHVAENAGYEKKGQRMARLFGIPAAALGSMVMTYMGTEQEETNMPLWASVYPLMAPFYAAVSMSNATAAMILAAEAAGAEISMKRRLNILAMLSGSTELVLGTLIARRWEHLPETRSYARSAYSPWFRHGYLTAGVIYPLVLNVFSMMPYGQSPARAVPAAIAKIAGVLLLQFVTIYAGRDSGRQARDYFEYTRPAELTGPEGSGQTARTAEGVPTESVAAVDRPSPQPSALPWMLGIGAAAIGAALLLIKRK